MLIKRKLVKNKIIKKKFVALKKPTNFFANFQSTYSCSIQKKYIAEDLYKAEEKIQNNKKKKKRIYNLLLLLVNLIVIVCIFVYYGVTSEIKSLSELLTIGIKWRYMLFALLFLFLSIIVESAKYMQLIKKATGKFRVKLSIETMLYGRYYDNVTPFSVGGEPFQIFYLNKNGVPGDKATSIPIVKNICWSAAFIILGIAVLISNAIKPVTGNVLIIIASVISLIANSLGITILIFFSVSRNKAQVIVIKILKFLNRIHLIKNYKATFFKVVRFVKKYQKSMRNITSSVLTLLAQVVLGVASYIVTFTMVYFLYLAFPHGAVTLSWADIFCCLMFCDLASLVMPLPGGTGLAEFSFTALFTYWFEPGVLPWALITWRVLTYFIYIVIGTFLVIKNYFITKMHVKKEEKQKIENQNNQS